MKRQRVRLRPKARDARRASAGRAAALAGALGAVALVATARPWQALRLPRLRALDRLLAVESVSVQGVPEGAAAELVAGLGLRAGEPWGPLEAQERAEALLERFPWLEQVSPARSWTRRSASFLAVPRRAVAAVTGSRRLGAAWLGEDGRLFAAPLGVVDGAALPRLDLSGWPDGADLAAAARLVEAARAEGALPSPAAAFSYDARERGWRVELADGTRLLWGGLEWTEEKLGRLREVMGDAGPRFGAGYTADLRFFEDGRILVRP